MLRTGSGRDLGGPCFVMAEGDCRADAQKRVPPESLFARNDIVDTILKRILVNFFLGSAAYANLCHFRPAC
jgi:hypothetical protein